YMVELVTRIGSVTMPNTAEMAANGKYKEILAFGMYLIRYCLALFMPLCIFLLVYGRTLILVWVGLAFAEHAAPLLPIFVASTALAVAAQFTSSVILFGLAKHQTYGTTLIVEGLLVIAGMAAVLPAYGITGAAMVAAGLAVLNRGIFTPFLLCRSLQFSVLRYFRSVYVAPLMTAAPLVP